MAVRDLKRIVERSDTPAGVWFDQIALAAIGKEGLTLEDFEPARVAAERLARERSPEDFN